MSVTQAQRSFAAMFDGGPKFLGLPDSHAKAPEYAEPLSETAMQIGVERLCGDLTELADFLAGSESVRDPSTWFGPISVQELVQVMFAAKSHPTTVLQAVQELRARFIEEKSEYVRREAIKAEDA